MIQKVDRRSFLKRAALTSAFPAVVPASALGKSGIPSPSNRITVGLIGCGSHGAGWNLDQIFRHADTQVIALCDVDRSRLEGAIEKANEHYSIKMSRDYSGCTGFGDFRDLINRSEIDAVANCTPDHWHVIPALMAIRAGKDVICEKPLTLTISEGRLLSDAVAEENRVFQTASENRSIDSYIRLCELVRNERIGRLTHIRVSLPSGNESRGANFDSRDEQPVPVGFDYEMWLGQAPEAPYAPARCHGSYRWIRDYSGGRLTDWGAHLIDLAQWANDSERTGPVEVRGTGKFPPPDSLFTTAYEFDLDYRYENGVTMKIDSRGPAIRFEGTQGWVGSTGWRSPLEASDPTILNSEIGPDEVHLFRPREVVRRDDSWRGGEHRNFFDCVKSREECYAPAEVGHRTATIAHMGNICLVLGRKLRWDPESERFLDDPKANEMMSRFQREPWTHENIRGWIEA